MTTTEYKKLKIDGKSHNYAKIYASLLKEEFQRKRAFASLVALYSFVDLLEKSPYAIQKSMTLFKNPQINEEYEVSDIYVNGWHIDVRIVTGGDAVLIPKTHFDNGIVPDFYAVIKVDSTLQNAELIGLIDTTNIEKEPFDYHYDIVPFSSLTEYDDFLLKIKEEKIHSFTEEEHELFRESYLSLLDNNIDAETKNKIIKHLFKCAMCRTEFCCFTGFEMVCCNTSKYPDVLEDHTLGFIGAQNAEKEEYQGKEETIYIGPEENKPEEKVEEQPEEVVETIETPDTLETDTTVSEILDGLFDMDEGTIQEEVVEEKPSIKLAKNKQENTANETVVEEKLVKENTTTEESLENETTENETDIDSIDDILNEVSIDTDFVANEEIIEETEEKIVEENENISLVENQQENNDLQMIDDSLFLDSPTQNTEIKTEQEEIQLIADEDAAPYSQDENIEFIKEEEEISEIKEEDEVLVINEEKEDNEVLSIISEDKDSKEEERDIEALTHVDEELEEVFPSNEEFIINDDGEIDDIDDEIIDEATMLSQEEAVQKVIVDYDENGEPIYSYITGIEQEEENSIIDDDVLLEEESTDDLLGFPNDEATHSEIEDITDEENDDEEYKSVYSIEDEETEETKANDNQQEEVNYEENEPVEHYEEEEEETVEQQPSIIDDILYDDSEEENNETFEYNANNDVEEENNDMSDYNNEEENNIDYNEDSDDAEYDEDGEYEDYDIEDNLPEEQIKKSAGVGAIIAILVLLGLIGGGAFFYLTKGKNVQEEPVMDTHNENMIETTENPAVNDMFEEPIETAQQPENVAIPETNQPPVGQSTNNETSQNGNSMFEEELPVPPAETPSSQPAPAQNVTMPELTENDLIKPASRKSNGDVNKTIINAFSTNASPVSLRALNWFCASQLFSDINFKNYLQTVDNSLKQNLKNNFMNLVESAPKDSVAAKFAIDNRGNLKKVIISESSGSQDIDNVVLQSINETFEREKSQILNNNELKQDMYYLKVVIKL